MTGSDDRARERDGPPHDETRAGLGRDRSEKSGGQESRGLMVPRDSTLREARAEAIRLSGGVVVKA